MMAQGYRDQFLNPGIIEPGDPPTTVSGMINLELDPQGRLISFQAIPPQKENTAASASPYDWNKLFAEAGLNPTQFQKAEPLWNSLAATDQRAAWTGTWPGTTRPLRIEAASFASKPVFFSLIGDWTKPDRMKAPEDSLGKKLQGIISTCVLLAGLLAAALVARRNYRRGSSDREGAFRLAVIMFVLEMLLWLCRGHFTPSIDVLGGCVLAISTGLFVSGVIWVLYLALEPWVRKRWPHAIISWSRLLSGKFRDPVVSRDILFGVMLGILWIVIFQLRYIPIMHMGAIPGIGETEFVQGGWAALGVWLIQIPMSIFSTLMFFILLLGLKAILRKDGLAAIVFVAVYALPRGLTSPYMRVELPAEILVYAIAVLIVFRFGLIPLAVAIFTVNLCANLPITSDVTAWYMTGTLLSVATIVALAAWAFYHSLGGQPIFKMEPD
jgi:hypothetical protein